MKIGYVKASKNGAALTQQLDGLREYGVDEIYEEADAPKNGKRVHRDQLQLALKQLRAGDTLVIWDLSRLSGTTRQLISLAEAFEAKGVYFISLSENLDTSTEAGKFCFQMFCKAAEMERTVLAEHGIRRDAPGRKPTDPEKLEKAIRMYKQQYTADQIKEATGVSKPTLYRKMKELGHKLPARGSRNAVNPLTAYEAASMYRSREYTMREIMGVTGLTKATVLKYGRMPQFDVQGGRPDE